MLQAAINKAGSTDPLKVALALEDMHAKDLVGQETIMRKDDHQLLMPYYAGVFSKDVKYDSEHTGFGWKTYATASAADPTTRRLAGEEVVVLSPPRDRAQVVVALPGSKLPDAEHRTTAWA